MNRLNIGLTGGIASGKNKACEIFEKFGFYSIDADVLSREIFNIGSVAYNETVKQFGSSILLENGEINRKALGKIIFDDKNKRKILESITHPAIWLLEEKKRKEIYAKNSKALIITHAALLIETGSYKKFNPLILVYTSLNNQLKRLMIRDNISKDEALLKINSQLSINEKLKYPHIIINNDSTEENLYMEVERVSNFIKQIFYGINH